MYTTHTSTRDFCELNFHLQKEILFQFGCVCFIIVPKMLIKMSKREKKMETDIESATPYYANVHCRLCGVDVFPVNWSCTLASIHQIKVQRFYPNWVAKHTVNEDISDKLNFANNLTAKKLKSQLIRTACAHMFTSIKNTQEYTYTHAHMHTGNNKKNHSCWVCL